ncbi:MAG: Lrp/AsnC ligand binding domain-containing protein [Thermoplasmata archaeon]|nr:Lrp/AsnC ligand binding domain-containing protein [Thermoplasmata archaeon]
MEIIYILAKVDAAHVETIMKDLKKVEGVKFAHAVTGSYDLLIEMKGPSLAKLLSRSIKEIGSLEGIQSTETLVTINLDD